MCSSQQPSPYEGSGRRSGRDSRLEITPFVNQTAHSIDTSSPGIPPLHLFAFYLPQLLRGRPNDWSDSAKPKTRFPVPRDVILACATGQTSWETRCNVPPRSSQKSHSTTPFDRQLGTYTDRVLQPRSKVLFSSISSFQRGTRFRTQRSN